MNIGLRLRLRLGIGLRLRLGMGLRLRRRSGMNIGLRLRLRLPLVPPIRPATLVPTLHEAAVFVWARPNSLLAGSVVQLNLAGAGMGAAAGAREGAPWKA